MTKSILTPAMELAITMLKNNINFQPGSVRYEIRTFNLNGSDLESKLFIWFCYSDGSNVKGFFSTVFIGMFEDIFSQYLTYNESEKHIELVIYSNSIDKEFWENLKINQNKI